MSICASQLIAYQQACAYAKEQKLDLVKKKFSLLTNKLCSIYTTAIVLLICVGITSCISLILACVAPSFPLVFATLCAASLLFVCMSTLALCAILKQLKLIPTQAKTILSSVNNEPSQPMQLFQDAYQALSELKNHQKQQLEDLTHKEAALINQLKTLSLCTKNNSII